MTGIFHSNNKRQNYIPFRAHEGGGLHDALGEFGKRHGGGHLKGTIWSRQDYAIEL